jgi:hypothetical protein
VAITLASILEKFDRKYITKVGRFLSAFDSELTYVEEKDISMFLIAPGDVVRSIEPKFFQRK